MQVIPHVTDAMRVAIKQLAGQAGGELDPKVVASLITILDRSAPG